jgi:hypothetical protein
MTQTVRLLSIDGGGIRGIIPAMVLAEIERRTGRRTAELFDLIAGNSIGGILALTLAKPDASGEPQFSAAEALAIYEEHAAGIFRRRVWHRVPVLSLVVNMLRPKYAADGLEAVLDHYLGGCRLADAVTDVIVGAYDAEHGQPRLFSSRCCGLDGDPNSELLMRDAARATSAAPGFFPPVRLEGEKPGQGSTLIDGAFFAENPGLLAYADVLARQPQGCDVLLVSLGCGQTRCRVPYPEARQWGFYKWGPHMVRVSLGGASHLIDLELEQLLPPRDGRRRFYRFQHPLEPGQESIDDISPGNLAALKVLARDMIHQESATLDELCGQLTAAAR